ncbi:hypothetical protein MUK70_18530 [Dyadobacter chenwenxiniae]|uniref:Uncharacterized protein n=1 Tax=Dyadobacter chenwenxiniae TaxID=2906456 RepID=A0A9X1TE96_9BACT|nr:hypothetical protein [Dyadobacter chenwenxiniae]MCF0061240.1 hypothetical protein [Dyadobacter chenwenxiniae]UON81062.1 hypothetical protein MUK70_18530 [Dyadobacter chenwenxiniae]
MQYEAYPFIYNAENTRFQFQSIGRRGVFEKVVFITPISDEVYNLSLVDYNVASGEYSDQTITDNGDMPEVLATVLKAIEAFLDTQPDKAIYFEGSSFTRTRLYQIAITKVFDHDKSQFLIFGRKGETWLLFEPNVNFEGFLIRKKP